MIDDLTLIDYSGKAVAIKADRDCGLVDEFELIGGRFNYRLKFGPGWIFSKKKQDLIINLYNAYEIPVISVALSDIVTSDDKGDKGDKNATPEYILSDKERKEWIAENNLPDYYYKDYPIVVRLSGGEIVPIASKELKTEFWFHDEGRNYEEYLSITENKDNKTDYFITDNLDELQGVLNALNGKDNGYYKRYLWLANFHEDLKNKWRLDNSNINPDAVNAIECLDNYERNLYNQGYYKKLSDDDKKRLIDGFKLALSKREKRCRTWLKRYGAEKLNFRTYWADR